MTVRSKFQKSNALQCVERLAWTGAQTDIFTGEDVALRRNMGLLQTYLFPLF